MRLFQDIIAVRRTTEPNQASKSFELIVGGFALLGLLLAEWMMVLAIHGTNYDGADGKMAQATILAAVKFGGFFQVTTTSPIEGVGSQLLPLNVWANPAYWPFHFFEKGVASDISALVALAVFAVACYTMVRCFDLPVTASAIAAQLCIALFAPMVLIWGLPTVFCLNPGIAVAYAPHLVVLGLVARLEWGSWRAVGLTTVIMLGLILYSLFCDPLWTMVNGFCWAIPFAVVISAPLQMKEAFDRPHVRTIVIRCASLGICFIVLLLSGALEYLYTLSRYTARVQFPELADRPRMFEFVSTAFYSPITKYFYFYCALGWLFGIFTLTGRPRVLTLAATAAFGSYLIYGATFLLLNVPWTAPIPTYVEQCLLPLYLGAAVAGYCGAARFVVATGVAAIALIRGPSYRANIEHLRICALTAIQRKRIAAVRRGISKLTLSLTPGAIFIGANPGQPTSQVSAEGARTPRQREKALWKKGFVEMSAAFIIVGIVPGWLVYFAINSSGPYAQHWQEPWPNEPELQKFFSDNIGRAVGHPIRGSVHFWTYSNDTAFTTISSWVNSIHTVDEYSQLVTPQAVYTLHALLQNDVTGSLNGFVVFPGTSWDVFFKALQLFGVRYYVADPAGALMADLAGYPLRTMPRRPLVGEPGLWQIYELPNPNIGNYSPTEVVTAASAPEMVAAMRAERFDFRRQVVLLAVPSEPLVLAEDVRLSLIRGGFHLSGHSSGTSLVVLPQQFSNCLRARDERIRLVRADLLMTGVIFSGAIDSDILLDYGIFTPECRLGDLADMRRLQMKVDSRMPHLSGDRLFPEWTGIVAKLCQAVSAIK
jgi:hypothetical protein